MTTIDCSVDAEWAKYLEHNLSLKNLPWLRPRGCHILPKFEQTSDAYKIVVVGTKGSRTEAFLDFLNKDFGLKVFTVDWKVEHDEYGSKEMIAAAEVYANYSNYYTEATNTFPYHAWGIKSRLLHDEEVDDLFREVAKIHAIGHITGLFATGIPLVVYLRSKIQDELDNKIEMFYGQNNKFFDVIVMDDDGSFEEMCLLYKEKFTKWVNK